MKLGTADANSIFKIEDSADTSRVEVKGDGTILFGNYQVSLGGNLTTQNGNVTINAVDAAKTLTLNENFTIGDGNDVTVTASGGSNRALTLGADVTLNQSLQTTDTPTFATPTANGHAAIKSYVDSVAQGLDVKGSVRAATTANGTLASAFANGQAVDGITLATGDRILLKNQTTDSENGIYTVNASGAPTRATDFDANTEVKGAFFFVEEGTTNANNGFVCTNTGTISIGVTSLTFSQFSGAGQITDGTGLTKSGNTLSVDTSQTHPRTSSYRALHCGTRWCRTWRQQAHTCKCCR